MDWTDIIVALIAGAVSAFTAVIANNKKMSVFQAVVETKLDNIIETQKTQAARIDAHNHLNERITKLEVMMDERRDKS